MPRLPQATHPQAKLLTEHCDVGIGAKPGLLHLGGSGDRTGLQQVTEALNGAQLDSARPGSGRVLLSCGSTAPETRRFLYEIVFPTSNLAGLVTRAFSLMMDLTYDISSKSWLKPPATTR